MSGREWLDVPVRLIQRLTGRSPAEPWMSRSAIRRLEAVAQQPCDAVELGAGSSTLWLAMRVTKLRSFEPDAAWLGQLRSRLEALGAANVDLQLAQLNVLPGIIAALEDRSVDLFVVDVGNDAAPAQSRVTLVAQAAPKVRGGGYLVLDNSDRPAYGSVDGLLSGWTATRCTGLPIRPLTVTETTFYRRPLEPDEQGR